MNIKEWINRNIDKKKIFIPVIIFIAIVLLGVLGKSFFFHKEYYLFILFFLLCTFIVFIYFFKKKMEFNKFVHESIDESNNVWEKIQEEKKDYFHIDKIINILGMVVVIVFMLYFSYTEYLKYFSF